MGVPVSASVASRLLPLLLIGAAGLAAYWSGLSAPFVFDDESAILRNPHVRQLWPLSVAMSAPDQLPVSGRPVVSLTLAVNYALGRYEPTGYHVFNLLVHVANGWLVYAVLRHALRRRDDDPARPGGAALAVALVWLVHPLISEAVVYVTQRTELLVALFLLATLLAAIRGWESPTRSTEWHLAAVLFAAVAVFCKEVAVAIPPLVLLYDRAFVSGSFAAALKRHRLLHGGLFATWGLVAWVVLTAPRGNSVGWHLGVSPLEYLQTQAGVLLWYLRASVWPANLSLAHDWPIVRSAAEALPALAGMGALFLGALVCLARSPRWGVLAAGFFLVLAPSSSFVPIVTEVAAERRMYLPLLAVVVPVVLGGRALIERAVPSAAARGRVAATAAALLVAAAGLATAQRASVYQSHLSIWGDAVAKHPGSSTAQNNLALAYANAGQPEQAVVHYRLAAELDPGDPLPPANLGMALAETGDFEGAAAAFEEARRIAPEWAEPYHKLGTLASMRQQWEAAIEYFGAALERNEAHSMAHNNLAVALEETGRLDRARHHLERCVELDPRSASAHYTLAGFFARQSAWPRAAEHLAEAARLDPDHEGYRRELEWVRAKAISNAN